MYETIASILADDHGGSVNSTHCGEHEVKLNDTCWCACAGEHHEEMIFDLGWPSIIGNLFGVKMSLLTLEIWVVLFFTTFLLLFFVCFPNIQLLYYRLYERGEEWLRSSFKDIKFLNSCFPKTFEFISRFVKHFQIPGVSIIILCGIVMGIVIRYTGLADVVNSELLILENGEIFALFLIPPLIMFAGFQINLKLYVENFFLICLHSVISTLIQTYVLAFTFWAFFSTQINFVDCLTIAALLSAVDDSVTETVLAYYENYHVNKRMEVLIISESVFNDALSIVNYTLFVAIKSHLEIYNDTGVIFATIGLFLIRFMYCLVVGVIVGVIFGFLAAFVIKFTLGVKRKFPNNFFKREHTDYMQAIILIFFGYVSYIFAETIYSSGAIALVFASLFMNRYVLHDNVSSESKTTALNLMKGLCTITEGLIYLYLGISVFTYAHVWDFLWILTGIFFVVLYRVICVVSMSLLDNLLAYLFKSFQKKELLSWREIVVYAFSGLRGAVPFILAFSLPAEYYPQKNKIVTTCLMVVFYMMFVQASVLGELLNFLNIKRHSIDLQCRIKWYEKIVKYIQNMIFYFPGLKHKEHIRNLLVTETNKNYIKLKDYVNKVILHSIHEDEVFKKRYEKRIGKKNKKMELDSIKDEDFELKEMESKKMQSMDENIKGKSEPEMESKDKLMKKKDTDRYVVEFEGEKVKLKLKKSFLKIIGKRKIFYEDIEEFKRKKKGDMAHFHLGVFEEDENNEEEGEIEEVVISMEHSLAENFQENILNKRKDDAEAPTDGEDNDDHDNENLEDSDVDIMDEKEEEKKAKKVKKSVSFASKIMVTTIDRDESPNKKKALQSTFYLNQELEEKDLLNFKREKELLKELSRVMDEFGDVLIRENLVDSVFKSDHTDSRNRLEILKETMENFMIIVRKMHGVDLVEKYKKYTLDRHETEGILKYVYAIVRMIDRGIQQIFDKDGHHRYDKKFIQSFGNVKKYNMEMNTGM